MGNRLSRRFFLIATVLFCLSSFLQAKGRPEAKLLEARAVLDEIHSMPDRSIPESLLKECVAIGVFPALKKGGYFLGGKFGKGILMRRDPGTGEWTAPAFFKIYGGSLGLQWGIQEIDLLLIFSSETSFQHFLEKGFKVGLSLAASAGPVGRTFQRSNSVSDNDAILAYSRSKGLFAGVVLSGAKLSFDYGWTKEFYGAPLSAEMILLNNEPKGLELNDLPKIAEDLIDKVTLITEMSAHDH